MAKSLPEILGFENLTGLIQNPLGGVPDDLLPPAFLAMNRSVFGNTATYKELATTRQTPRRVSYGDPSKRRQQAAVGSRAVVLHHTFEHEFHDVTVLQALQQFDNPQVQAMGRQLVDRQVADFRTLFNNLRVSMVHSALSQGSISWDGDGNLLPSTVGAQVTADFNVPANNKNQLNGIIGVKWSDASAKIITDVAQIKKQSRKLTGHRIRHAFYGENILDYLLTNNQTKELLNRDPGLRTSIAGGTIPDGFLDLTWWSVNEAFFEDQNGTNQEWYGVDDIVFTPDPNDQWYLLYEGSYAVPTNLGGVSADAAMALGNFRQVSGMFSYALVKDDPPSLKHLAGDTSLPVLRNPSAIFIATVEF